MRRKANKEEGSGADNENLESKKYTAGMKKECSGPDL